MDQQSPTCLHANSSAHPPELLARAWPPDSIRATAGRTQVQIQALDATLRAGTDVPPGPGFFGPPVCNLRH
jgi:hypothetical protein